MFLFKVMSIYFLIDLALHLKPMKVLALTLLHCLYYPKSHKPLLNLMPPCLIVETIVEKVLHDFGSESG